MARSTAACTASDDHLFTVAVQGYSMDEVEAYVEAADRQLRRMRAEIQRSNDPDPINLVFLRTAEQRFGLRAPVASWTWVRAPAGPW